MAKMRKGQTKVVAAKTNSDSLRTTIPSHIVELMRLRDGDTLEWQFEMKESEGIVKVRRFKG